MSGYGRALPRRAGAWRGKKWIGGCHDKLASKQVYTSVFATEAEAVTALAALRTRTEAAFDAEMQRRYAAASQSTPTLADLSCTRLGRRKAADAEPQKPGRRQGNAAFDPSSCAIGKGEDVVAADVVGTRGGTAVRNVTHREEGRRFTVYTGIRMCRGHGAQRYTDTGALEKGGLLRCGTTATGEE